MNKSIPCFPLAAAALALSASANDLSVTVYNQNFAVVREAFPLALEAGMQSLPFAGMTTQLEPASVVLRDTRGEAQFRIVEQSYRGDPVSQGSMLQYFEGESIDFIVSRDRDGRPEIAPGTIIRSGYTPGGGRYDSSRAIIDIQGSIRFGLPGQPLFPSLGDDSILTPTLNWVIEAPEAVSFPAELSYVTGGMSWSADYNFVYGDDGGSLDLIGWVTVNNRTGKVFDDARIKLMAGDVNKVQPQPRAANRGRAELMMADAAMAATAVTEKKFDEFHLYNLPHRTTLRDQETKQVEFVRASGVEANRFYVYRGSRARYYGGRQTNPGYGDEKHTDVETFIEFDNSEDNQLGIPLPAGRTRFYRKDSDDGQLEFVGENTIDHTPKDETVELYLGNAFDLVGERTVTDFDIDSDRRWMRESFDVELRNRSEKPAEIRVVESLYRWSRWEITGGSMAHEKKDSQTIEFRVPVEAESTRTISYTVEYRW